MKRTLILLLVATVIPAALGQAPKKHGEVASLEKVEIQGEAKPGASVVALVHVKLEKGWHVQSNKPSEPTYVPTVLNLSPTEGVRVTAIKYPEGKSEKVQGLPKPLSIYDEDFTINALLTLDAKASLPLTIPGALNYQACQGAICYPPRKLKLNIVLGGEEKQKQASRAGP